MDFSKVQIQNVKMIYMDQKKLESSGLLGYVCLCGLG